MKQDKILHVVCGAFAAAWVSLPAYLTTLNLFAGLWACLWTGILCGGIKEWCDMHYGNKWDWWDFLATCLGAVIVALLIVGMHYGKG
jgi:ABC-type transporter Mla maintaining outer membrane lipid asymmetry permease subunit MlaE